MAKSGYSKTRVITDKVAVKGVLSDDGCVISYIDEDKKEKEISISECLDIFTGRSIDLNVTVRSENDIPEED